MSQEDLWKQHRSDGGIELAIVIPFYKIPYLDCLLSSLSRQTNKNFRVYIGDDSSPSDPVSIIEQYRTKLPITYFRFNDRLGHVHLTQQWQRCLHLIKNEKWVWVLPDDDLPSLNVVEEFYTSLAQINKNKINVIRLPMQTINEKGNIIGKIGINPVTESNYEFYSRLVRGETASSLGDNIFRRSALESSGGFIEFPKAWGSDHATILNVASGGNIYCLQNTSLGFRMSGENISSNRKDGHIKMAARVQFARWLKANESIFLTHPSVEFYKHFYWKGEHYALHEFSFSFKLCLELYRLRKVCTPSLPLPPFIKLLFRLLLLHFNIIQHTTVPKIQK